MRYAISLIFTLTYLVTSAQIGLTLQQSAVGIGDSVMASKAPVTIERVAATPLFALRGNGSNSWSLPGYPESTLMTQQNVPSYQPRHYGFFCKVESKIEYKSKIAPRFRLGSADYVDALEGKYVPVIR